MDKTSLALSVSEDNAAAVRRLEKVVAELRNAVDELKCARAAIVDARDSEDSA